MKELLLKIAEDRGNKIPSYLHGNIRENLILPKENLQKMNDEEFVRYYRTLAQLSNENACGYNGWSGAQDILVNEFGYKKEEQHVGHRCFVSLCHKDLKD